MDKKKIKILILSLCLPVLAIGGYLLLDQYLTYKYSNIRQNTQIHIYKNATYSDVLQQLEESGALRNTNRFLRAAQRRRLAEIFEPGHYVLVKGMSNDEIIRTIANAWQVPYRLVLNGRIRSLGKLASVLGKHLEADSAAFYRALTDSLLIDSLGFTPENIIGMFIPNTYEIYWTISPRNFVLRMHREYERFWNDRRSSKAKRIGLSRMEVITLASIVSEESNFLPELPIIAGVYINRIKKGIRLQADPTIRFIASQTEPNIQRILKKHLRINSPYNTYKHKGLPPGPICIPSIDAIEAVLNYQKHNYLYFCAKPTFDGRHNFTASYQEHMKNAREYQKELSSIQKKQRETLNK